MHDLGSADTKEDSKNFETAYFLSQRRVEARATLFNITKMKSGRESDRLDVTTRVIWVAELVVISRDRGMQPNVQTGNSIREGRAEIRIGSAAVAGPPTGIHRELLKVRKSSSLRDERDLAGWQIGELPQVNLLLAFGCQMCIQESCVTQFIIGVVRNILGLVPIQNHESFLVS